MLRARSSQTLDSHSCDHLTSVDVVASSRIWLIHFYAHHFLLTVCFYPYAQSNYLCPFELQHINQANDMHTVINTAPWSFCSQLCIDAV